MLHGLANSSGSGLQAESVRKAEEERMKQEVKDATLRAAKERLERLQSTWREDQQLKEVCICTPANTLHTCLLVSFETAGFPHLCPTVKP